LAAICTHTWIIVVLHLIQLTTTAANQYIIRMTVVAGQYIPRKKFKNLSAILTGQCFHPEIILNRYLFIPADITPGTIIASKLPFKIIYQIPGSCLVIPQV
jgi:hypothetical protein